MRLIRFFAPLAAAIAVACGSDNVTDSLTADPANAAYLGPILDGSTWQDVSANCGVRSDGTLWCWSWQDNAKGGVLVPAKMTDDTDWKAVSSTGSESCGQKTDGTLYCWTLRSFTIADFPGGSPVQLSPVKTWSAFAAGVVTQCGLQGESLFCWGRLDPTERGYEEVPQLVDAAKWQHIAPSQGITAMYHVCGIRTGNELWCWGDNTFNQTAASSAAAVTVPVKTPGTWSAVAASPGKTCGIDGQGALRCWGQFPLADETGARWTAVSTAADTGCGLHDDGSLWCWGKLPGDGAVFSSRLAAARGDGWAQVSVGNDFLCARKASGAAACLHLPRKYAFLEPYFYATAPVQVK